MSSAPCTVWLAWKLWRSHDVIKAPAVQPAFGDFLECLKLWAWSMRVTSKNIRDLRTCPPSSSLNPEIPEVWGRRWSEPPTSSRSWTPRPRCRWPRSSWMLEWRKTLRGARFESSIWLDGSPRFYQFVGLTLYRKKTFLFPGLNLG